MYQKTLLSLFLLCMCVSALQAQKKFAVKSYLLGYRISEIDPLGTNPLNISPLLKNPNPYNKFISGFHYNGLYGSPGPQTVHTFYLNTELYKPHAQGFWKRAVLRTGVFVTNKLFTTAGSLENLEYNDTMQYKDTYKLWHNLEFTGVNLGISKILPLGKRLQAMAGIEVQGGIAVVHNYTQQRDSIAGLFTSDWYLVSSTKLPTLQARNYFQWGFMVPLAMQYEVWKNKWTVRVEAVPAIAGSRFRSKTFAAEEAHAAGLWLIYHLR